MKTSASSLLCLLLLAIIGSAQATSTTQSTDYGWRVFSPADKSFSVELPSAPEHKHDPVLSDDPLPGESYSSIGATSGLAFFYVEVLCATKLRAEKMTVDSYLTALFTSGKTTPPRRITVDGFPGREMISRKPGSYLKIRWISVGSLVYTLTVISGDGADPDHEVDRFFDSFHVTRSPSATLPDCPSNDGRFPVASKGKIHVVVFPGYWMSAERGRLNTLLNARWYEVRSAPNNKLGEFLFGAMSYRDEWAGIAKRKIPTSTKDQEQWYSRNFYAVTLADPLHIREVPLAEWRRARKVSHQSEGIFSGLKEDTQPETFAYHGREYAKSSVHWGGVIVSPGGRWLAVYSHSATSKPGLFGEGLFGGRVTSEGDIYWDVYDTKTGEKILTWSAKAVAGADTLHVAALWVGEDYLVMPFGSGLLRSCVIGVLPRN